MIRAYDLEDQEAAVYAAAYVLYPYYLYLPLGREASYFMAEASGDFVSALVTAHMRRLDNGTHGTTRAEIVTVAPKYKP